jgi:hypothetical protein
MTAVAELRQALATSFARMIAKPGTPATFLDKRTRCAGLDVVAAGRSFAVQVRAKIVAITNDAQDRPGAFHEATSIRLPGNIPMARYRMPACM